MTAASTTTTVVVPGTHVMSALVGPRDEFLRRIEAEAPGLARVAEVHLLDEEPATAGERGFRIEGSEAGESGRGRVTVDAAVCRDCVGELFDPADRRHRHALINCTNCGPRYSIVTDLPYDRPRTTMAGFPTVSYTHLTLPTITE